MMQGLLPHRRHNSAASSVSMRFWARSIGERNPAFVDESYAGKHGGVFVAHPCWLYSVQDTMVAPDARGRLPVIAGTEWIFDRPVVKGDMFTTRVRQLEQRRTTGRLAGDTEVQRVEVCYHDGRGERVARAVSTLFLIDPEVARESRRHADWKRYRYSEEELAGIEADYDRETVRGDEPRYWEDVHAGEQLPLIVRGPMSSEEAILFVGATRPCMSASEFTRRRGAGEVPGFLHPGSGIWETYAAGLVDDDSARQMGFPAAHDLGLDRIAQMASLLTNWIGDTGQLLRLEAKLLGPHMLGDTSRFGGEVIRLERAHEWDGGLVYVDVRCVNQRGDLTAQASSIVRLPCKEDA